MDLFFLREDCAHLVQHVPDTRDDFHLKLALHLTDHEFLVESVRACEDEQARGAHREESRGEVGEPVCADVSL
jgi:hypothetical protein